jgi:putative membrane protein
MGWFGPVIGLVVTVGFFGLIAWLVVTLSRRPADAVAGTGGHAVTPRPTPADLLAERFARGEIDAEEYDRRRRTLRED